MIEKLIVWIVLIGVGVMVGWSFYRTLSGKGRSCSCGVDPGQCPSDSCGQGEQGPD